MSGADIMLDMAVDEDVEGLARTVRDAAGALIRRLRHESGTSLTWSQSVLLSGVARHGRVTASDLASENGLRPQTVWTSLATLERRQLVSRERDAGDRRNVHVWLTDLGLRELQNDRHIRENWMVGVLANEFTAEQRAILAEAAPLFVRLATWSGSTDEK